ncbi:MAG: HEAT repeat domain-containing protein [Candidatus Omnitrophica bacterium]|nr:HEAT repeat domain-containing protein [Candidatus Omnitrophota bacterium]
MAIKKKQELVRECDAQRDSLFASFGRLLYENIQSNGISYAFEPEDPELTARAKRLVRDVVVEKISDRKPRLDPFVIARRKALVKTADERAVARELQEAAAPVKAPRPVKAVVKPKKNPVVAVFKGMQNVLASALSPVAAESADQSEVAGSVKAVVLPQEIPDPQPPVQQPDLGRERRGQLEAYSAILIDLHVTLKKLREIRNDLNDGITVGLLYANGGRTAVLQAAVDEKFQTMVSLIEKKQEAIRLVMETKKQFFAQDKDNTVWKPEADFLKELELDAAETSRRVDGLIGEVVDLFKNIRSVYEKDVNPGLADPQAVFQPPVGRASPAAAMVAAAPVTTSAENTAAGYAEPNAGFAEASPLAAEEVGPSELIEVQVEGSLEEAVAASMDSDSDDTNGGEDASGTADDPEDGDAIPVSEKVDYGLFETGSRKLLSEAVDQNEKLSILHTLFRNAPRRVVPYFYELVRDSEIFIRRQLVSLLGQLDYPTLVDLYRRFITDESSSLRLAGMMGLVKLGSDEAKHVVVSAVNDRDANVRRFIINHLVHDGSEPEATAIARLSRDNDEMVARIAVRKLGLMSNHFAFVSLVPLLESPNIKIRKEVANALVLITGTDLGYDCGAPESERARCVRQWRILSKESYTQPRFLRDMRLKYASKESAAVKADEVKPAAEAKARAGQKTARSVKKPAHAKVKK